MTITIVLVLATFLGAEPGAAGEAAGPPSAAPAGSTGATPASSAPKKKRKATKQPAAATAPLPPATPPAPALRDRDRDREVRQIPIDDARANKIYRIRTAPGYPATIEFPERFTAPPACGDCASNASKDKADGGALFLLDVFNDQHYVTIKPRLFPGPQPDGKTLISPDEFITTLNVRLEHYALTLQIELSERDKADARVVFTLPQRSAESQFVRDEIAKARKKLEQEFADKLEHGVVDNFLRALSQPHHCSSSSARARHDDVVVEVAELCFFGNAVYVKFSIENRGRIPVELPDVVLKKGSGKNAAPVSDPRSYLPTEQLDFQKTAVGIIGFQLAEGEEPATAYEITVREQGGRYRQVTVSDLSL